MIFDYILNNRFYATSDEVADIIPTTPHNRLETFLNMIVGELKGMAAVDPIKPISEMEYWLNEIAAAKGGNPWKDASGDGDDTPSENKYTAKKVMTYVPNQEKGKTAYMVTVDLGIEEIPYDVFGINADIDGHVAEVSLVDSNTMVATSIPFEGDTIDFGQDDLDDSYVLTCRSLADQLAIQSVRVFFIHGLEGLGAQNFKLQMFIYPNLLAMVEAEPPAEKEMTITVTLVEDTGK